LKNLSTCSNKHRNKK